MDKEEYKRQNDERDIKRNVNSFRERWFGWWKTPSDRFAALIALFTAVLALVAYCQLDAMHSTDIAIHEQFGPLKDSADAAKKAAVVAEKALTADQRPWVSLKSMDVVSDLIWKPDGAHLDIHFVLKNTGHSPAVRAFPRAKGFVLFGREPNPQTAQNQFCEETKKSNVGDAIFPGDFVIQPQGLFFDRADVDAAAKNVPVFKFFSAMILVCVNYQFIGESANHQTSYIFTVQRKTYTDKEGRRSIAIYPDDIVPASEITFQRFVIGFDAN